jgi:ribose/xylose/arabinose/galactoside ABC-type transport system permease subunit
VLTGAGSPLLGILAALGTAVLVGLVQGSLIAGFRLNSMPVTLGGYLVVLGVTYILGHSKSVVYQNYTVGLRLDKPVLQIFSIRSLVAVGIFAVAAIVLRYLRVGRDIRAIGGDRRAARVAGVSVDRLLVGVFVVSAVGAALPGALLSYSLATASPTNIGFDVLTFSATAALIGGVSLSGGKGGAGGIAAGVLSLSVLEEILSILNSPDYVSSLITGGLLVVVTIVWAPDLLQWFRTTRVAAAVEERA